MIGTILTENSKVVSLPSNYQPSQEVKDFTVLVKKDYGVGYEILHRPYQEYNNTSFLDEMDNNQKAWLSSFPAESTNPDHKWRWNGTRPITRNKLISIAAHVTSQIIFPNVFAQDSSNEEDKDAAAVMREMIEWNIRNSDYELSFLYGIIAALINPLAYFKVEFVSALQNVKIRHENGEITTEKMIDEVLSGMQLFIVPMDEVLFANPYQFEWQRQRFQIHKRYIDYDEAKALFGEHENFHYVRPGVQALYNENDGVFYDQYDQELNTLCEHVNYQNRLEDTEVNFINGIYLGDSNPNKNPIKHRDTKGRPRYNLVKFGYEPIDEKRFIGFKSAASKLVPDQKLTDRVWKMTIDGSFLNAIQPTAVIGSNKRITSDIMFPGGSTNFPKGTEIVPLGNKMTNPAAGFAALNEIERSMTESSQSEISRGISEKGTQTAYEISRLEENARTQLGLFGKMIYKAVKDIGDLMIYLIIHHQTIAQMDEISGSSIKFKTFLVSDQYERGKKVTKKIQFTDDFMGKKYTKQQILDMSYDRLAEGGGIDGDTQIYKVNPYCFSKLSFKITVAPDALVPKNERLEKVMDLEGYDRMIQNPLLDQEAVTRDFLVEPLAKHKGNIDKYIKKNTGIPMMPIQGKNTMVNPGSEVPRTNQLAMV